MKKAISILWILLMGLVLPGTPCYGATADQFVVFGLSRLDFGQDIRVTSGDVGSNGTANFARKISVQGSVFANRIIAGRQSVFSGDVHFNTLQEARQVSILANRATPLALPVLDGLPPIAGFSPGRVRIIQRRDANAVLDPGDYDKISIGRDSVIVFTGGVYNIRLVEIGANANVSFLAPATLNVSQRLTLASNGQYRGAEGVAASDVLFNYSGAGTVRLGRGCLLELNILAPRGRIALERDSTLTGALLAGRVTVGRNVTLALDSAFAVSLPVPDLLGLPQADAETALMEVELAVGTVTTANSDTVQAGDVISQQPAAGTEVEEGTVVDLEVSLGPAVILVGVPDLLGLPQADAGAALAAAGLAVGEVTTANSDTVPAGDVIGQRPAAGTEVEEGTGVDVEVSHGPAVILVDVPGVVGLSQGDAEAALVGAGLAVGEVTTANSDTVPAGDVIGQQPAAGTEVEEGTVVDLVVSLGAVVDTTPPSLTINAPADGDVITRNPPVINVSYSDDTAIDTASLAFAVNGKAIGVSCQLGQFGGQCTLDNPLIEGLITVVASIQDLAGNFATDQVHFTMAKAAPAVTNTNPADAPAVDTPEDHSP